MQKQIIEKNIEIYKIRHSMAHIMAYAVRNLFSNIKLGFGPAIENGFYYDFDFNENHIEMKDLKKIEQKMRSIINEKIDFIKEELDYEKAIEKIKSQNENYKEAQINKLYQNGINTFSFYKVGDFIDLCEGPHVSNTSELSKIHFKLDRISGAYWLGSEKNKMLTRIYALCYETESDLKEFLMRRKNAERWDHKKLGKELDLFLINETIGKGLILWTPNGTCIREEIEKFAKEMEFKYGYNRVFTPHIAKEELFLQSGHLPAYKESMFPPIIVEEGDEIKEKFYLKPMNCPFHHIIYSSNLRSYRDLPLRLAEYGTDYRFEQSGELSGLLRVRSMTMNDAHIYLSEDNLEDEIVNVLKMYSECYEMFGLKNYYYRLSIRGEENKEKFIGSDELWNKAENILTKVLKDLNIPYALGVGEAAFYGPKIDIQFKNLLGREETVSTIQVDFQSSLKFDLSYISENGEPKRPVIIHRAPLSTHERFVSFLIEHFAGAFPVWLSPIQVMIIPVSSAFNDFVSNLQKKLHQNVIRAKTDFSDNSLSKKIRTNVKKKIPLILVIGQKEVDQEEVTIRRYGQDKQETKKIQDFISDLLIEIKERKL